jgi:hypothetical protein
VVLLCVLCLRFCCHTRSIFLNFELPEREYSKKGESMCPKDGWVCYRNSNLISGRLGKVWPRLLLHSLTTTPSYMRRICCSQHCRLLCLRNLIAVATAASSLLPLSPVVHTGCAGWQ